MNKQPSSSLVVHLLLVALALTTAIPAYSADSAAPTDPTAATESTTPDSASSPSFSEYVIRGYQREVEKNYAAAVEDYTKALELREASVTALIRRAYAYAQLGEYEASAGDLKAVRFATPISMSDYTSLAWLKATCPFDSLRDGVVAVAFAHKALKERESDETFDVLGAAYAEMRDYQRARNAVLEALKRFPDSPRAEAMRGRLALYNEKKPFRESWVREDSTKGMERALR
ncbi:MAG: tetratricopeptide repeat protein [Candidatus Methylacidiphilales bacterium]